MASRLRASSLPLAYDEITPGPRNAAAVVAIAHLLHPAAGD